MMLPSSYYDSNRFDPVCPVCLVPASIPCSRCRLLRYCSINHQKEAWRIHRSEQCITLLDRRLLLTCDSTVYDNNQIVIEKVKHLLALGASVNAVEKDSFCRSSVLLDNFEEENNNDNDDVSSQWTWTASNRYTPLSLACGRNNVELMDLLIRKGADMKAMNGPKAFPGQLSLLDVACINGFEEAFDLLVNRLSPLNGEIAFQQNLRASRKQLAHIHYACHHGNLRIVEKLLDLGVDINYPTFSDESPLLIAAKQGYEHICIELVRRGAKINGICLNASKIGFFELAMYSGYKDLVCLLIRLGCNIQKKFSMKSLQSRIDGTPLGGFTNVPAIDNYGRYREVGFQPLHQEIADEGLLRYIGGYPKMSFQDLKKDKDEIMKFFRCECNWRRRRGFAFLVSEIRRMVGSPEAESIFLNHNSFVVLTMIEMQLQIVQYI